MTLATRPAGFDQKRVLGAVAPKRTLNVQNQILAVSGSCAA